MRIKLHHDRLRVDQAIKGYSKDIVCVVCVQDLMKLSVSDAAGNRASGRSPEQAVRGPQRMQMTLNVGSFDTVFKQDYW